ncbi:Y-family DNA polymerase [Larkinella arboricola]
MRAIGIVDCNNFYVSCLRSFMPKLIGQPVIALSNNDGCVVARSNEAKKIGIKMGQPLFQITKKIFDYNVQVFSSNYELFGDMSRRVFSAMQRFVEEFHPYSVDEAFFSFNQVEQMQPGLLEYCQSIRSTVDQWTRIPVSIGLAETMTLAKVANKWAKSHPEHQGVFWIDTAEKRDEILDQFPIQDLWGVGRQYQALLKRHGIKTALQFSKMPHDWIQQFMTVEGLRLIYELQGIPCRSLDTEPLHKKSICVAPSFGRKVTKYSTVYEALATYLARAAEKLRKHQSAAGVVTVFLHTNRFDPIGPHHYGSMSVALPHPSSSTTELLNYAEPLLKAIWKEGYDFQKVGVILNEIMPVEHQQKLIFADSPDPRHAALSQVVDQINLRHGRDKLRVAAQGYDKSWKIKQRYKSPCYTTKWSDILTVK